MRSKQPSIAGWLIAAAFCLAYAPPAQAFLGGISSAVFTSTGCPLCHFGGTVPTVLLSGPDSVAPGETVDYTLTIFSNAAQNYGGLNVAASLGTLSVGGPFSDDTHEITGPLSTVEITHSAPKPGNIMNQIEFSFQWTAPPGSFSSATLRGWGNAVNNKGTTSGDAAALDTFVIIEAGSDTPIPTATPTPTPMVCAAAAPLAPPVIADPDARACQAALAKAGNGYVKKVHKVVRKCLKTLQRGVLSGEAIGLCAGSSAATAPTNPKTAAVIARTQDKVRKLLAARCTDADLALLDACAATEPALEQCFLAQHHQAVLDAVASEYGTVVPLINVHAQKCQTVIGNAAGRFLLAQLSAAQTCLTEQFSGGDGAVQCIGGVVAGAFVPPTDPVAAAAMAEAEDKMAGKILSKCDADEIAAIDTCGFDPASTVACLLCTHRHTVFDLLANEFGGS